MEENWIKLDFCNVDFEPPIVVWAVDDTRAWINGTTEKERNNCTFDYLRNNIILFYIIPTLQFLQNSWRPFPPFLPHPSLFENCSTVSTVPPHLKIWKIYHLNLSFIYTFPLWKHYGSHDKLLMNAFSVEWLTKESKLSFYFQSEQL